MKVTIHFKDKKEADLVLKGESLRAFESRTFTHIKACGLGLIASIPTANIQSIVYERETNETTP